MVGQLLVELSYDNQTSANFSPSIFQTHLTTVLRRLGSADKVGVELLLVGDKKITALNQQFLGHKTPTDVLSFPQAADRVGEIQKFEGINSLGSIVISVDAARRQAKQAKIALETELQMLSSHGLLHLLGYHHL